MNVKHILLDFPADLGLSAEVLKINEDNMQGELTMEMAPIVIDLPTLQSDPPEMMTVRVNNVDTQCVVVVKHSCPIVYWRVAINEVGRKLGSRTKKAKKKSAAERAYEQAMASKQAMNSG